VLNPATTPNGPLVLAQMQVLPGWIDYNGHMTESRYLFAGSETCDAFLRLIGADMAYVKAGHSYYTAETHIMHLGEAKLGDHLTGTLQILGSDEKRIHLFIRIKNGAEDVASVEQILLHVDMKAGKTVPAPEAILAKLRPLTAAHASLPKPGTAGRHVGQRKS
jgi:carnitine 3-dehydrogenase